MQFFERQEKGDEIVFVYTYRALYYYAFFLAIGSQLFASVFGGYESLFGLLCLVVMIGVYIVYMPANREVKSLLKQGASMRTTGSRFSLTDPLVITMKKG